MRVIRIGRSSQNDFPINDPYVGRFHCQIMQHDNGQYTLSDLGSSNGTYVNGIRVSGQTVLNPNDVVRIGNTTLPWRMYFEGGSGGGWQNPSYQPNPAYTPTPERGRNWFVVFYLILSLIGAVFTAVFQIITTVEVAELLDYFGIASPFITFLFMAVGSILIIVGSILLLAWRKSGYWLTFAGSALWLVMSIWLLIFAINFYSERLTIIAICTISSAIATPLILWAILQISKNSVRCWKWLR